MQRIIKRFRFRPDGLNQPKQCVVWTSKIGLNCGYRRKIANHLANLPRTGTVNTIRMGIHAHWATLSVLAHWEAASWQKNWAGYNGL